MSDEVTISVVSNAEEFASLKNQWNALLENSAQNTVFLRWEWLYNWWQVYGKGSKQLCIYTAWENGMLCAIAPLYVKKRYYFFTEIAFLGSNVVCSDHLDFILYKGREEELLNAILSAIAGNDFWDTIKLKNISSASIIIPGFESFFKKNRFSKEKKKTICPYLPLEAPWDLIYTSYSTRIKKLIKSKSNQLEKRHKISYYEARSELDVNNMFDNFLRVNKSRFEQKKMQSPFCDADFTEFHKNVIAELAGKDMIRFYFVKAEDEFIAANYVLAYNDTYSCYQISFEPAWKNYSPGTLLFHHSIKTAHDRGLKEFDFLQGGETYKINWTKAARHESQLRLYNITIMSICLYFINIVRDSIRSVIKKLVGLGKRDAKFWLDKFVKTVAKKKLTFLNE